MTPAITSLIARAKAHGRLSAAEEVALASAVRTGNLTALERMVEGNISIVISIARTFRRVGVDLDDLVSVGLAALADAARGYDPRRGARFGTYATLVVRQQIIASLRQSAGPCRFPRQHGRFVRQVSEVVDSLRATLNREPSDDEVSSLLGVSRQRVRTARALRATTVALDAPAHPGGSTLSEMFPDQHAVCAQEAIDRAEMEGKLRAALQSMSERERRILELRFGLHGNREHTLLEVADRIGVCKERVRQLEELTLVRLRRAMAA